MAHELRNTSDVCSAHLFVYVRSQALPFHIVSVMSCTLTYSPGWVHTGMTGAKSGGDKPAGAWTAEQTVEYMVEKVFDEGDFYVICPDNDTSSVRSPCGSPLGQ